MSTGGGKGSGLRPTLVSKEQFSNNWDTIFGKKKTTEEDPVERKERLHTALADVFEWKEDKHKQLNAFTTSKPDVSKLVDIVTDKYCLGTGCMEKCNTCQFDQNWKTLNQLLDVDRKEIQANMIRVNESYCQMTHGSLYLEKR